MTGEPTPLDAAITKVGHLIWTAVAVVLIGNVVTGASLALCFYVVTRNDLAITMFKIEQAAKASSNQTVTIAPQPTFESNVRDILKKQGKVD
jgi:hypothetical protein